MEYILLLQILITEIHPTPAAGEPEWVECVVAATSPVDLGDYLVCDNTTCVPLPSTTLTQGTMLLITRDPDALRESRMIDAAVPIIRCALPSLNNTSDCVEIRRRDSLVVDHVIYSVSASERGRSIERHGTNDNGAVTYLDVWSASLAFDSATCGRINSHVEYEHDVAVTGVFVQDSIMHVGLLNNGRVGASGQTVVITIGQNRFRYQCPDLRPKQWWSTQLGLMQLLPTAHARSDSVIVELTARDMRIENNVYRSTVVLPPMNGGIMITEILADPRDGDCDFVEIWNGTADSIDLFGWTLQDNGGDVCRILQHVIVAPQGYVACASDTAIVRMCNGKPSAMVRPSLNVHSQQDNVILRTPSGFPVDSASYDKSWHASVLVSTKGRSLEKRVPQARNTSASDWGSSTDAAGSTPAARNTIEQQVPEHATILVANPSPFSTVSSAARHPCVISWSQPFDQAMARMSVLRLDGSVVAELLNGEFVGSTGAVTWDGTSSVTSTPLPIGIYIAAFECIDAHGQRVVRGTCPIVIGESR